MRTDIATQADRDAIINGTWPKLYKKGWKEYSTVNVLEGGVKTDIQTIYINPEKPGKVFVNKVSGTIETTHPLSYEELYWFSLIGVAGGYDEDEWAWG